MPKVFAIKPTKPGYLLIKYLDGDSVMRTISEAPKVSEIVLGSPIMVGDSKSICPHCNSELKDLYRFVYFSKIINGRVYSYDSSDWREEIISISCESCGVTIFDWELSELYIDYIPLNDSGNLSEVIRLEPVICFPGKCPGERAIAINDTCMNCRCSNYPKCLRTMNCEEDWRIVIGDDKIKLTSVTSSSCIEKILSDNYNV